jgi:Transposase zinc-ribbon domain
MDSPQTLQQAIQYFSDYENCRQFMVSVRWPDGKVRCPNCGSEKVGYLEKARVYRRYGDHAKQKFSLKVGTIFEDSPIPLEFAKVPRLILGGSGRVSWLLWRDRRSRAMSCDKSQYNASLLLDIELIGVNKWINRAHICWPPYCAKKYCRRKMTH